MSPREVVLSCFGAVILLGLFYQARQIYRWWCKAQERKRELERQMRRDIDEIMRQVATEKIPESFRREMMACIPVEHGGSFRQEGSDGTSQAPASGLPFVQAAKGRAGRQEPEKPVSVRRRLQGTGEDER